MGPLGAFLCWLAVPCATQAAESFLSVCNSEAPFCYLQGGTRDWPFLERELPSGSLVSFVAKRDGKTLAQGKRLRFSGLMIGLNPQEKLEIVSQPAMPPVEFTLGVSLQLPDGQVESQTLSVRSAPPRRPISYLADFGDDLIRIFMDTHDGHWRPIAKSGFDQYFRRCQAHGVHRLILWQSPFPYICDPTNYAPEDWDRYEKQARAMVDSEALESLVTELKQRGIKDKHWGLHVSWGWVRQLCALRLRRDLGLMIAQSAAEHGIALTASFRPFETALTKYYEIPTFDYHGKYLWGFLPWATPVVNYHPEETCFAHYRTILRELGQEEAGQLGAIEIPGVEKADVFWQRFEKTRDNLRIVASNYAPLQEDSLVLQRQPDGQFLLRPFGELKQQANQQQLVLTDFRVEKHEGSVRITNLHVPQNYRYLILSNPSAAEAAIDLSAIKPVQLFARAGNRLGRENVFWVLDKSLDPDGLTKVAGIPTTGRDHTEFQATENSQKLLMNGPDRLLLKRHQLVIDLGAPWSVEMMDLNRAAMRANVVKEMATLLDLPAFDELLLNTRSHVSLAASMADGEDGVQPFTQYRKSGKRIRSWLGLDRAFAPLAASRDPLLQAWASDTESVEKITTWQPHEWEGLCQKNSSPFRWRYVRNREVAAGVRRLLEDLQKAFPGVRTRIVLPLSEQAILDIQAELDTLLGPNGKPYGRDYSRIWTTINHIRAIGEGMAMVDLEGLSTEPVFFGVRGLPEPAPFQVFLRHSFADLADNHGSSFRGPRSFFFEAQESLRRRDQDAARRRRAEIICTVLSHPDEVNEVILYEAADWLYFLPMSNPDLCSHAFVEDCLTRSTVKSDSGNSGR